MDVELFTRRLLPAAVDPAIEVRRVRQRDRVNRIISGALDRGALPQTLAELAYHASQSVAVDQWAPLTGTSSSAAIIIVSPPRTGTSLLHFLIAAATTCTYLSGATLTAPALSGADARRVARNRRRVVYSRSPALRSIHPLPVMGPDECTVGLSHWSSGLLPVAAMSSAFVDMLDADADDTLRRLWAALPSDAPPVCLKSTDHGLREALVRSVFPRALLVYVERNERELVDSWLRLCGALRQATGWPLDSVERRRLRDVVLHLDDRARASAHVHLCFTDLRTDPVRLVRQLCAHSAIPVDVARCDRVWQMVRSR